jgi:oligopeptide/dipeptide ABC transporter ATP-binding protein
MRSTRDSAEEGGSALLELRDLCVGFETPRGPVEAVRGVTLDVRRGECLAVVGESGSGKSQMFLGAFGLLAGGGRATGAARFDGRDLLAKRAAARRELLGARAALVFQDPMNALTPHLTVGRQLAEGVLDRGLMDAATARARSLEVLRAVRLPDPEARLRQYPHELSGGQRQRVAIAMALMTSPELLVADEPTTALDVTVQAQVVEVLAEARDRGLALVLITHDLGVVAGIADRVAVMYAGRLVEVAPVHDLYAQPRHPYTAALLASVPRLRGPASGILTGVEGQPPSPGQPAPGCAFAPRCGRAEARCRDERPALEGGDGRAVACHAPLPADAGP